MRIYLLWSDGKGIGKELSNAPLSLGGGGITAFCLARKAIFFSPLSETLKGHGGLFPHNHFTNHHSPPPFGTVLFPKQGIYSDKRARKKTVLFLRVLEAFF